MSIFLSASALILALILLAGLSRVIRGPTAADRMLATQLFGTTGVALLIVIAVIQEQPALINVALVIALLAPLTLITFIKLGGES